MDVHPGTPFPHYGDLEASARRKRRIVRILSWSAFLLWAIPVTGWVVFDRVEDRRVKRTIRKLEKAGIAVDVKKLTPAPVPPLDNAAPLYEAAFEQARGLRQEFDAIGEEEPAVLQVLERYRETFELARRARLKPYCRFERNYGRGPWERTPEYGPVDALATALSRRALALAGEGNPAEARETIRDLWGLVFAFRGEPLDGSQTCLRILGQQAVEATVRCSRTSATESDWRQWQELLPDAAVFRESFILELRADLAFWTREARKGYPFAVEVLFGKRWIDRVVGRIARPVLSQGAVKGLERLQKRLARWEHSSDPLREELRRSLRVKDGSRFLFAVVELTMGSRPGLIQRMAVLESALAVARAGMECERVWTAEGRYPEALTERDPMTGRPLEFSLDRSSLAAHPPENVYWKHYRPEEDGLVWNLLRVGD